MALSTEFDALEHAMQSSTETTPPAVALRDVHKSFNEVEVLKGISFEVQRGEVVCLIGPSGSGKSTIIRCVNALNGIDSGSIQVEGQEVNCPELDIKALRRKVGIVFQQYNLFPHMSAMENIALAPMLVANEGKIAARDWACELLEKVHLGNKQDAYPGELSGGQQQRVAIARSLAMRPSVMLFDEVTAALDPENVKEVLSLIKEVAQTGVTCIVVTHEMEFARNVADHVYFTDRGVIVEHGPPDVLFQRATDVRTQQFLDQIV